jgi:hypothetical protein
MKLQTFCKRVNDLARKEVEKINQSNSPFKGVHYDYCEMMLKHYHEAGYTPKQTLDQIEWECEQECRAEALAS